MALSLILFPSFLLVFPHIPEVLLIYQLSITIRVGKSTEKVRKDKSHAHMHTEKDTSLSKLKPEAITHYTVLIQQNSFS